MLTTTATCFEPEQAEQVAVAAALFAHALVGGDEQQGGVGPGRAGDHVLEKFLVARGVDEHARTPGGGPEGDLGNVDGDVLVALGLEGVHEEGPLEGHATPLAGGLDRLKFTLRERAGVVQEAADERGLAVIDVADDDDAQGQGGGVHDNFKSDPDYQSKIGSTANLAWRRTRLLSARRCFLVATLISSVVIQWVILE